MLHKWLILLPLPYVQQNAAFFFREKACACSTTRKARLVRTRRKKDAERGEFGAAKPACRGRLSFARTCIRYLRERILYSVNTNTRRQAKLIVVLLAWLGNAIGVFNEYKSNRADGEYRFSSLAKQRKVSAPLARDAWLKLHPTLTTKHQLIFRLPHLTHTKRQPETAPRTHL